MYFMRTIKYMVIACGMAAISAAHSQEVYRCKSSSGTVFSDSPCGSNAERLEYKDDSRKTPTKRLIGHWSTASNDNLYFSPVKAGGRGRYILLQGRSGRSYEHNYRIIAEDSDRNSLEVELLFADGDSRPETYVFSEDGKTMTSSTVLSDTPLSSELQFVDSKTQPDKPVH